MILLVGSKETKLIETENESIVARGRGWGICGEVNQRGQTSSYKMSKFRGSNARMVTAVNNNVLCI